MSMRGVLNKAIDMEDSRTGDYSIRLLKYHDVLAQIQFKECSNKVDEKISKALERIDNARKETEEQMNHYRVQSIELLGLFAALVSFVVSSVQFISGQSIEKRAYLMLIFTGSLLCIYGGLGIILHGEKNLNNSLVSGSNFY